MALGAAGNDAQAALNQLFGHRRGIDFHLFGVIFESRLQRFFKRHGFGSNHMHQGAALQAGENGGIECFFVGVVAAQNHAAARAAQGFVGGSGHEIGKRHGVGVFTTGNQAGIVRHVYKKIRAYFVGDFAEFRPVDFQRISRCAGHDHFGFVLLRQTLHFGIIEHFVFIQAVGNGVVELAGNIHRSAVGEVAAVGETHAQNGVARLQYAGIHGLVGLRAGMRLHIGIFGAEKFFHAVDGQLLGHIDMLAAAVIAFARIAFGIFVGELAALGFHHGAADVVFRGNQLNVVLLALNFGGHGCGQLGVVFFDGNAF